MLVWEFCEASLAWNIVSVPTPTPSKKKDLGKFAKFLQCDSELESRKEKQLSFMLN